MYMSHGTCIQLSFKELGSRILKKQFHNITHDEWYYDTPCEFLIFCKRVTLMHKINNQIILTVKPNLILHMDELIGQIV